ncbi:MAG: type II toxin-antitoxin system VapC family toxin [Acidimicrobiia bacterium]
MRLLLDTHIWLWGLLSPQRLSRKVAAALEDPENELWLSSISAWEAMILAERGRIELDSPPADWVALQLSRVPMRDAPVTRDVAIRSRTVALAHDDPADRFIAATAAAHSLTLVTADERLAKGSGYSVLVNRAPLRRPG